MYIHTEKSGQAAMGLEPAPPPLSSCAPSPSLSMHNISISSIDNIISKPPLSTLHIHGSLSLSNLSLASSDFGNFCHHPPLAFITPSSVDDISTIVRFAATSEGTLAVAARGNGHSIRGQAQARDGLVIDMRSVGGIEVCMGEDSYVDACGGELWIDVLKACLEKGYAPPSWPDYLYLTVGGTLQNAGIGGQTFKCGPVISNVLQLEVVTGRGEFYTCSPTSNEELFFAMLGGLGQFGIITKARIRLVRAPEKMVEDLQKELGYIRGLSLSKDVGYLEFLNRVHAHEKVLRELGMWQAPHPWLCLLVPHSHILELHSIMFTQTNLAKGVGGPMHMYPMLKSKWDARASVVVPEDNIFYLVSLLRSNFPPPKGPEAETLVQENEEILGLLASANIPFKVYMPHFKSPQDCQSHFGSHWQHFVSLKQAFDPLAILAPGQCIFPRRSRHSLNNISSIT